MKPRIHARDHLPTGPDPLVWPAGLIGGFGTIDYAVTNPGGLIWRYQCDEASGALVDTSLWPAGPTNLSYYEELLGADPVSGETWDGSQAVVRAVMDHPEFGDGDNGALQFVYDQLHHTSGVNYPGAYFYSPSSSLYTWGSGDPASVDQLKSVGCWFKPSSLSSTTSPQGILGYGLFSDTNDGYNGWDFRWVPVSGGASGVIQFTAINGGGPPARGFSLATPGPVPADLWYRMCVTMTEDDGAGNTTWTLMINGLIIASVTKDFSLYHPASNDHLTVGMVRGFSGGFGGGNPTFNSYFLGEIDEIEGYKICLSLADEQAIFAARGAGFGTTIDTVTLGAGDPSTAPGAISAGASAQYEVLSSQGDGTTAFQRPRIKTYHNGA